MCCYEDPEEPYALLRRELKTAVARQRPSWCGKRRTSPNGVDRCQSCVSPCEEVRSISDRLSCPWCRNSGFLLRGQLVHVVPCKETRTKCASSRLYFDMRCSEGVAVFGYLSCIQAVSLFERRTSNCAQHMSLVKCLGGSTTDVAANPATTATSLPSTACLEQARRLYKCRQGTSDARFLWRSLALTTRAPRSAGVQERGSLTAIGRCDGRLSWTDNSTSAYLAQSASPNTRQTVARDAASADWPVGFRVCDAWHRQALGLRARPQCVWDGGNGCSTAAAQPLDHKFEFSGLR